MNKKNIGSTLDSFLEEEGLLEEVEQMTRKKVIADSVREWMRRRKVSAAEMARRMGTSRSVVYDSLLDAKAGVTLDVLERASAALDMDLEIRLVARRPKRAAEAAKRAGKRRAA